MCLLALIFVGRSDCECVFADVNMHYYISKSIVKGGYLDACVFWRGEYVLAEYV